MDIKIFLMVSSLAISLLILVPLSLKWELNQRLTIPSIIFVGLVTGILTILINQEFPLTNLWISLIELFLIGLLSTSLIAWRFFRDPERASPDGIDNIVSAADGEVIYIKRIDNGEVPISEKKGRKFKLEEFTQTSVLPQGGYLIGIGMSFLDVHVNRAPIDGKITLLKRISGLFLSLKLEEAVITNERALIVIDNGKFKIGLVQIASRLVRKIVPFKKEGDIVSQGTRIGVIKFGSQVDMVIPDLQNIQIKIKVGDHVYAGKSIIATLNS